MVLSIIVDGQLHPPKVYKTDLRRSSWYLFRSQLGKWYLGYVTEHVIPSVYITPIDDARELRYVPDFDALQIVEVRRVANITVTLQKP